MSWVKNAAIGAVFVISAIAGANAQGGAPDVYGALDTIEEAVISPDGNTVAMIQNSGEYTLLVLFRLDKPNEKPWATSVGGGKARGIEWIDNEHLALLASVTNEVRANSGIEKLEFYRWLGINIAEKKSKMLFGNTAGFFVSSAGTLMSTTPDTPKDAVFARFDSKGGVASRRSSRFKADENFGYSLLRMDVATGRERTIMDGKPETLDWIVDSTGEPVFRIDRNTAKKTIDIYRRLGDTRRFESVHSIPQSNNATTSHSFWSVGDTPNEIIVSTFRGDTRALGVFDLESGKFARTIFQNEKYDFDSVDYDPRTATVKSVTFTDDLPRSFHLDEKMRKFQKNLGKALPGAASIVTSQSADGSVKLVRAIYPDRPAELYTYDAATKNLAFFASTRPGLSTAPAIRREKFDYVAADGMAIPGYLTTPAASEKKNLPLIVLPHGGPASRDTLAFDWWAAFYAANGYAVYQPNFRGSSGYGDQFRKAGEGEWGKKMQSDVFDGAVRLVEAGIADPARICIVGASYGGYAALAGATLTPLNYACAVSVNGVSDLPRLIGEASRDGEYGSAYWERLIGSRFTDGAAIRAVSPALVNISRTGAPVMIIHGKDDTVVPYRHAEVMVAALKKSGRPYEIVTLDGEDHWLSKAETRTKMLADSLAFIEKHIGD